MVSLVRWFRNWRRKSRSAVQPTIELTLYSKRGCHLCDEMKSEIARARLEVHFKLVEVDIDSDPSLQEAYGRSIPVLAIDGRPAFKGRLTAAELRRKLDRRIRDERGS